MLLFWSLQKMWVDMAFRMWGSENPMEVREVQDQSTVNQNYWYGIRGCGTTLYLTSYENIAL